MEEGKKVGNRGAGFPWGMVFLRDLLILAVLEYTLIISQKIHNYIVAY
ncbi:MAG: hypothetical protein ACOCQC_01915 [Halanaerobiaceae bacterium]